MFIDKIHCPIIWFIVIAQIWPTVFFEGSLCVARSCCVSAPLTSTTTLQRVDNNHDCLPFSPDVDTGARRDGETSEEVVDQGRPGRVCAPSQAVGLQSLKQCACPPRFSPYNSLPTRQGGPPKGCRHTHCSQIVPVWWRLHTRIHCANRVHLLSCVSQRI